MGQSDTASTSAARLRLLQEEMALPRRGAEPGMPRATAVFPPAPVNLGLLAHIQRSVTELVHETRAVAPDAGPAPAEASAVYAWMTAHTSHLDDARAQYRQAVVYRQGLEHALLAGDETVIRRGEDVLAEVKSSWCCLDAETLRPARLAREIVQHFFPSDAKA